MLTLDALQATADDLATAHRELAELAHVQKQQYVEAWWNDASESVTARDRSADYATLHLTTEIIKIKGEIAALQVEWETQRFILDHTSAHASDHTLGPEVHQ